MLFHGEVELTNDPGSRLPVTLTMDERAVSLSTGEETLGSWGRLDADAVERSRGRYDLTLGGETLVFTPDNAHIFASRGLAFFHESAPADPPAGFLAKMKTKWTGRPDELASAPSTVAQELTPSPSVGPLDAATAASATPSSTPTEPSPFDLAQPSPSKPAPPTPPLGPAEPEASDLQPNSPGATTNTRVALDEERPLVEEPLPLARIPEPIEMGSPVWEQPTAGTDAQERTTAVESGESPNPAPEASVPDLAVFDLPGLLARLEEAVDDLREGRMEPARGRAIADVVRAMCRAVEISGQSPKGLSAMADTLEQGELGSDLDEDEQ